MKPFKINVNPYENLCNAMKVFRGQEASLESSKVYIGAAGRILRVVPSPKDPYPGILGNRWKPMKIFQKLKNLTKKKNKLYSKVNTKGWHLSPFFYVHIVINADVLREKSKDKCVNCYQLNL